MILWKFAADVTNLWEQQLLEMNGNCKVKNDSKFNGKGLIYSAVSILQYWYNNVHSSLTRGNHIKTAVLWIILAVW